MDLVCVDRFDRGMCEFVRFCSIPTTISSSTCFVVVCMCVVCVCVCVCVCARALCGVRVCVCASKSVLPWLQVSLDLFLALKDE